MVWIPVFAAAQDVGVLATAITALITALITGVVSVLNWVQRMRESGAKAQAEEAKQASIAQQAALDGLKETYRQGWELLNKTIISQQEQITAQQGLIGQLQGQLSDCRDERQALATENRQNVHRIEELERKVTGSGLDT